jgi:hypothetical protein
MKIKGLTKFITLLIFITSTVYTFQSIKEISHQLRVNI